MASTRRLPMVETAPAPSSEGETELRLADIPLRQACELVRIDLPHDELEPLLERGVLPGCELCPGPALPLGRSDRDGGWYAPGPPPRDGGLPVRPPP